MKKSLSALKEKFGKFEISKEQVKTYKGGVSTDCTDLIGTDPFAYANCVSGGSSGFSGIDSGGGQGGGDIDKHCPANISEQWCHNQWSYPCGNFEVCFDPAGYSACIATCKACCKC